MIAATVPEVGHRVPPLRRRISQVDMVAYAGATWDWHRMHHDAAWAASRGLPAPVVDGQVFGALLVETLQDWLGPLSFVAELEVTYRALVFAGEEVECRGRVVEAGTDSLVVDLEVVVTGTPGQPERPATGRCRAVVLLGSADGPGALDGPAALGGLGAGAAP